MPVEKWASLSAFLFIVGFAIQQFLQILDPLVVLFIRWIKKQWAPLADLAEADLKKSLMALISFLIGWTVALTAKIHMVQMVIPDWDPGFLLDSVIGGLVLGSGTEAANTFLKFAGYVKDGYKLKPEVTIAIAPAAVSIKKGRSITFAATVKNSTQGIVWSIMSGDGGTIDAATGHYTAPDAVGVYYIRATSQADPLVQATAAVTVTE